MAGERTIRIRFDGSARGLQRAAARASRDIEGVQSRANLFTRVMAGAGAKFGKMLPDAVSGAFSALPPQVQGVVAIAGALIGAALASAAGAAITAGILLAVGGGVLAAGIVAAAKSPKVKAAWSQFKDRAKTALADFGKPFEGPVARAAGVFAGAIERMSPTLKQMGESMAPIIDKLAPTFAQMAEKALPGIQKAMEKSKPLFDKIAEHLPKIGDAISSFFDTISKGAPDATTFLDDFLTGLEWTIKVVGWIIVAFAKFYSFQRPMWVAIIGIVKWAIKIMLFNIGMIISGAAAAFGWIPGLGPKLKAAAEKFHEFQKKVNHWLDGIEDETVNVNIAMRVTGNKNKSAVAAALAKQSINLDGRAVGGPVSGGRSYLVGENGPEIVKMGRNGYVTPNHKLADMGGTTIIENHIEIGGEVVRVVRTEVANSNRGLKRRTLAGAR